MMFVVFVLFAIGVKSQVCDFGPAQYFLFSPPSCSDCSGCRSNTFQSRFSDINVWTRPEIASKSTFECRDDHPATSIACHVKVAEADQAYVASICNAIRGTGNCCYFPNNTGPVGQLSLTAEALNTCQRKTCLYLTSGCNFAGFCSYFSNVMHVTENCCTEPDDCPPTVFGDPNDSNDTHIVIQDTPLNRICGTRACVSGNCRNNLIPMCCLDHDDCLTTAPPSPFHGAGYVCAKDPNFSVRGTCVLGFHQTENCTSDFDCGSIGLANQCATGTCVTSTNRCNIQPRNLGSLQGCCDTGFDETCETADLCLIPLDDPVCNSLPTTIVTFAEGNVTTNPDFRCRYETKRPEGCCTSNADCFTLSSGRPCVSGVCDLVTHRCQAGLPSQCAQASADCEIPDPYDMCTFHEVVNPTRGFDLDNLLFRCSRRRIDPCPLTVPPNGLAPNPFIDFQSSNCTFDCPSTEQNSLRVIFRVINSIDMPLRPLYFYRPRIMVTNPGLTSAVVNVSLISVTESRMPFYQHYGFTEQSGDSKYQILPGGDTIVGPLYNRTFIPNGLNTLSLRTETETVTEQGDRASFLFSIRYSSVLPPVSLSIVGEVDTFDICVPYYLGQPGCTVSDIGLPMYRNTVSTPPLVVLLSSCSSTCSSGPTPPPSPVSPTPAPTPTPSPTTTGSSPTPVPSGVPTPTTPTPTISPSIQPPLPSPIVELPMIANSYHNVTLSVLDCSWQCNDVTDGTHNRVLFELKQVCNGPTPCLAASGLTITDVSVAGVDNGPILFVVGVSDNVHIPSYQLRPVPTFALPALTSPTVGPQSITSDSPDLTHTLPGSPLVYYPQVFIHPHDPAHDFATMKINILLKFRDFLCTPVEVAASLCASGDIGNVVAHSNFMDVIVPWSAIQCSRPCDLPTPNVQFPTVIDEPVIDCQLDCDSSHPNILKITQCMTIDPDQSVPLGGELTSITQLYYGVMVKIGSSLDGLPLRVYQNGSQLTPSVVFADSTSANVITAFVVNQPAVLAQITDSFCFLVEFDIDSSKFNEDDLADTFLMPYRFSSCSIIDTASGRCPSDKFSSIDSLSVYESILDVESDSSIEVSTRAFIVLPGNSQGRAATVDRSSLSTSTCSEPCVRINIPDGNIGGLIFFDANGDGDFDEFHESVLPNIRVRAFTTGGSLSSVLLATTLSNSQGIYSFNRTFLHSADSGNVAGRNVIFRINTPERFVPSPHGVGLSPEFNNRFSPENVNGTAVVSPIITSTTSIIISAGFQDRSTSCSPPTGPLPDSRQLILSTRQSDCDSCQDFPFSDPCAELCQSIPTATYRRVLLEYNLHNNATTFNERSTVVADLAPLYGMVHCLEPTIYRADSDLRLLEMRRPKLRPPYNKPATASYGVPRMSAGQMLKFGVLWSMCFVEDVVPAYNSSFYVYSDRCVRRVRERRTCVQPNIDISDCVSNLVGDLSGCDSGCEIPVLESGRPRNESAPVTLAASTDLAREQASCITHNRIDSYFCPDLELVYDVCSDSGANRTAVVAFARVTANDTSEAGSFTITLTRKMPEQTLVCGLLFDPQVEIVMRNSSGFVVENTRARVINSRVDADRVAVIDVAFASLLSGESIEIVLRELECAGAELIDYKIEVEIKTDPCIGEQICRSQASYRGRVDGLGALTTCLTVGQMANQTFVHQNSRGPRAHEAHENVEVVSLDRTGFWIIVSLLILLGVCCFCFIAVYINRRRRMRKTRKPTKRAI